MTEAAATTNTTRVMLVEDEPALIGLLTRVLGRAGFEVDACATGAEAMSHWEGAALAIVDLGLPDMPGEELVAYLFQAPGDAPIIVSSGTPVSASLFGDSGRRIHVLPKPYLPQKLLELIHQLLAPTAADA